MAARPKDKTYHLALLLPLVGLFMLMPPAVLVFGAPVSIAGIPLIVVYIFTIWACMIIGAALLARRLRTPVDIEPAAPDDTPFGTDRQD